MEMKQYSIEIMMISFMAPYIPKIFNTSLDIWKEKLAPLLRNCGFLIMDYGTILGTDEMLIEFKMYWSNEQYRVTITELK